MNWINIVLISLASIVLGVISGFIIAYLSRDELVDGRKWFKGLVIASFVFCLGFLAFGLYVEALIAMFILIVSWVSYVKSKDKQFVNLKRLS